MAATFTFDYLSLLCIASTIAGIGLATNNTVAIVASMLVSPIMGPVLALTFGSVIGDRSLMYLGLKSELISLSICILIGFVIGLVAIGVGTDGLWPTDEMRSRGLVDGLILGLAIAIPSGAGVALSVLGNNTSSLVGVAISASLLPPAVNCGMSLAYALIGFQYDRNPADDNDWFASPQSYADMGGVSLALTLVNIGAIYMSGLIMFKLKEVAPLQNKTAFWQKDIQISRRINKRAYNSVPKEGDDGESGPAGGSRLSKISLEELQRGIRELRKNPALKAELLNNVPLRQGPAFGPLQRMRNVEDILSTSGDQVRSTAGKIKKAKSSPSLLDMLREDDDEVGGNYGAADFLQYKFGHTARSNPVAIVSSIPMTPVRSPAAITTAATATASPVPIQDNSPISDIKARFKTHGTPLTIHPKNLKQQNAAFRR